MKETMVTTHSKKPLEDTSVSIRWKGTCPQIVEAIQNLLTDGSSVDVRVRCKDHQPLDGLGAHRLVLAAASPDFLSHVLSDLRSEENEPDQLLCIHLPDYTSAEVGPVMSLVYYGEVWICESYINVYQKILDDLRIAVKVTYNACEKKYSLIRRDEEITGQCKDNSTEKLKMSTNPENVKNTSTHVSSLQRLHENHGNSSTAKQSHLIRIKCEPPEDTTIHPRENASPTSDIFLKTISASSTQTQPGSKSNSVSPILIHPSTIKPTKISIKQEIVSLFVHDRTVNQDSSDQSHLEKVTAPSLEKEDSIAKRVRCKSELVDDSSSTSQMEDRFVERTIKTEPFIAPSENPIINLKQEPPDEYDINIDIASPITTLHGDNESIAEDQEDETSKDVMNNRMQDNISEDNVSTISSLHSLVPTGSNFDAYMDCSRSEISQDDAASSTIEPTINVIACNEDPASGCSYLTSSLSSYQAHRLTHQRKLLKQEAKETYKICKAPEKTGVTTRSSQIKCETANLSEASQEIKHSVHTSDNIQVDQRLFCDFQSCSFSTKSSSNLTQHLRVHNDEKTFECPTCSQKFRSSSNLKVHVKSIHTKEKMYTCDYCEKRFATKWQKQSHTKTNHIRKREVSFDCTILGCGRTFLKYQSLAAHMKSGHKVQNINTPSHGLKNNQSNIIAEHYTAKKPLQICENCGKRLKGGLKAMQRHHRLAHCTAENESEVQCSVCNKFIPSKSLKSHLEYHKKKEDVVNNTFCGGNLSCQVCQRTFTTIVSLQRHRLIHENIKPHICSVCKKRFRQKGSLDSHFRIHTGVRWRCEATDCGKLFITKSLLNQHIKATRVCREMLKR